ncbi:YpoC family protein [Bacillus sp. JCM 19041]|uniref:YpoC family protein n=1 Tax=Bacillus sp. JCM 19041 TaxID=1460637 RepID=UPI0006D1DC12
MSVQAMARALSIYNRIMPVFHTQKEELSVSYRHRQAKEASFHKSKALMLQCLFWINQEPVNLVSLKEKMKEFTILPINAKERVLFVLENDHYVSFLQLCALFEELEKLNARTQVRNTLIKQRGRR